MKIITKDSIKKVSLFVLTSYLISLAIFVLFYVQTDFPRDIYSFLYYLSIPVYYLFFLLLAGLLLSPLMNIKYLRYLIVLPKILFDIFLITDYFVFKIYHFHIDTMFIMMVIEDFKGFGLSSFAIYAAVFIFLLIAIANILVFRMILRRNFKIKPAKIILPLILLLLYGQLAHIWANEYNQQFILKYTPYFPYYFPTTSSKLMGVAKANFPFLIPAPKEKGTAENPFQKTKGSKGLFYYPAKSLEFNTKEIKRYNILLIVLESWRYDMLQKEIMPNLFELANKSHVYTRHFSGGNVTTTGLYSLMYGLHPSYMRYCQSEPKRYKSVLVSSLRKHGYNTAVYTGSNLNRFGMRAMFFTGVDSTGFHEFLNDRADISDKKVVEKLIPDIHNANDGEPWFKFVFLTSSHHNYFYPDSFAVFKPVPDNSEGFVLNKNADPIPYLNDYKNALHYEDALISEVLEALKDKNIFDSTLIIITADHGEEFNDNKAGYWGHGSNFTKYQTSIPLIIHFPGDTSMTTITATTLHIDIVPAIMKNILKCKNDISVFSNGRDILHLPPATDRKWIIQSYKDKAYIVNDTVYSSGLGFKSYMIDDIKKTNKKVNYKAIKELKDEESLFLKSK